MSNPHSREHLKLAYEWAIHLRGDTTQRNIAKIVGVTEDTVSKWFHDGNAPFSHPPVRQKKITQGQLNKAEELLNDGASLRETGRTLGISYSTVAQYFPGRGWSQDEIIDFATTMRKASGYVPENKLTGQRLGKAKQLLESGIGYEETHRRTGISTSTLHKYFRGYGLSYEQRAKLRWEKETK